MAVEFRSTTPLLQFSQENVGDILKQYNRTVSNIDVDVDIIKRWLNTQPHLPFVPSDRQIATFLNNNKFSIERTKQKLDFSFTIKSLIPEYFREKYPLAESIQNIQKVGLFVALPKLTDQFNRVMILQFACKDPNAFDVPAIESLIFQIMELRTFLDISSSDEFIVDLAGAPFGVLRQFGPMELKKSATVMEKVYSNRINAMHIVNVPSYAEPFIAFLKAALQPKIRNRVKLHKSYESLRSYYPREILPEDFGGDEKPLATLRSEWKELLEQYDGHFRKVQDAVVNESLRPVALKNDDILGFHGNFRKLEVD